MCTMSTHTDVRIGSSHGMPGMPAHVKHYPSRCMSTHTDVRIRSSHSMHPPPKYPHVGNYRSRSMFSHADVRIRSSHGIPSSLPVHMSRIILHMATTTVTSPKLCTKSTVTEDKASQALGSFNFVHPADQVNAGLGFQAASISSNLSISSMWDWKAP